MTRWAAVALALALSAAPAGAQNVPAVRIDREVGSSHQLSLEAGQNRLLVFSDEIGRIAVADPAIADLKVVTPTQVLLTAKSVGSTDLTLWNRSNQPFVIALQVGKNLEGLRKQIAELFPGEKVTVTAAGELVVLSGQVNDLRVPERISEVARLHAKQVANLVQVGGNQQVQLEVRFAEVSRTGLRDIGFNFFAHNESGSRIGGGAGRGMPGFMNIPGTGGTGMPPQVLSPQFANQGFNIFFSNYTGFPFSAVLSVLEENGLAKVLAEPTLVTLSGQEARFLAGGEIPIPVASALGTVNVEWKKFGVLLNFTPTVINDSTIHLHLAAEVSDVDPTLGVTLSGYTIPGLSSRQSETTVRLGNGQSFAIAGLMNDRVRSTIDKVPILGSIPILGALFRSSSYLRNETELLVVITARLAHPVAPHELKPLPTDFEHNDPDDFRFFLMGLDGTTNEHVATGGGPSGPAGFTK